MTKHYSIIFIPLTLSAVWFCLFLALLLFEGQDTMVHHSAGELVDALFLLETEAQDVNSVLMSTSRDVFKRLKLSIRSTNIQLELCRLQLNGKLNVH